MIMMINVLPSFCKNMLVSFVGLDWLLKAYFKKWCALQDYLSIQHILITQGCNRYAKEAGTL
jgi:hypothetical protein